MREIACSFRIAVDATSPLRSRKHLVADGDRRRVEGSTPYAGTFRRAAPRGIGTKWIARRRFRAAEILWSIDSQSGEARCSDAAFG